MKPLLETLLGKNTTPPPLWLMRQAGRYLPEYREIRAKAGSFLDLVYNPELAAEVTLQPIRRFGFDGAILFSDILIVPHMLGQEVTFKEGEGPQLGELDIDRLTAEGWKDKASRVWETVSRVKAALPEQTTLIGFAGSPWTVACYMVEGGSSPDFAKAKAFARSKPAQFEKLMDRIINCTLDYVEGQVEAGAEAIQLFDSWAGRCDGFQRWVVEPTAAIVHILKARYPKLPIIGFPRLISQQYMTSYTAHTSVNALSLDETVDLDWASKSIQRHVVLQGNLHPDVLLKGGDELKAAVDKIKQHAAERPWIFNLGHGITKETPVAHVEQLVKLVRG